MFTLPEKSILDNRQDEIDRLQGVRKNWSRNQ